MIVRLSAAAALLLSILLAVLVGLIQTRAANYLALEELLTSPERCVAPCWQGIQPGTTPVDVAVLLLERHPWVVDVERSTRLNQNGFGTVRWRWSGLQPVVIDPEQRGSMTIREETVQSVILPTRIRFGDVWLSLNSPGRGQIILSGITMTGSEYTTRAAHNALFNSAYGMIFTQSVLTCPLRPEGFWNARVVMQYSPTSQPTTLSDYDLTDWYQRQPVCSEPAQSVS